MAIPRPYPPGSFAVTADDFAFLENILGPQSSNPLETWKEKESLEANSVAIWNVLRAAPESFRSEALIKLLSEDPDLAECYQKFSGTGEGYSIGEHSERVLASFEKDFRDNYSSRIPLDEFRLFLALHDIGKGSAVEEIPLASPARKEKELEYTSQILEKTLRFLKVPEKNIRVFLRLVKEDLLGDYLKQVDPDPAATIHRLKQLAREAEMDPVEFLNLFEFYFKADASSYPILHRDIFSPHPETGALDHSPVNAQKMEQLRKHLDADQSEKAVKMHDLRIRAAVVLHNLVGINIPPDPQTIRVAFLSHLPQITARLQQMHQRLLLSSPEECVAKAPSFKKIKKECRDLLRYLALSNTK